MGVALRHLDNRRERPGDGLHGEHQDRQSVVLIRFVSVSNRVSYRHPAATRTRCPSAALCKSLRITTNAQAQAP